MNAATQYAVRTLDDLADARTRLQGLCRPGDAECDEAVIRFRQAHSRAILAIREAIPGPACPGEWGQRHRGNRALVHGGQMFVLVERDFEADVNEAVIVVVPLGAISGLERSDS